jgi:uncharacterized protein (DUF488 family)
VAERPTPDLDLDLEVEVVDPGPLVYSFGYHGWRLETVAPQLLARGLTVVDIRLKPYSRTPEWNQKRLEAVLGPTHYLWLGASLGNRNYKGGPIDIIDLDRGLQVLRTTIADGHTVVVMCMCPQVGECHRQVVLDQLRADGLTVVELAPELTAR